MIYLILSAVARFSVELLRLNPIFAFGMTQAQFISVVLFIVGLAGFFYLEGKNVGEIKSPEVSTKKKK